jgi:uncharacterized protein
LELKDSTLTVRIAAFCRFLREHGFRVGTRETEDALRAVETIGALNRARFRAGLRTVICAKREELDIFDSVFEAFFGDRELVEREVMRPAREGQAISNRDEHYPDFEALVAKYSAAAAASEPPSLSYQRSSDFAPAVSALVRAVALGRSRRWKPQEHGERFDLRRTLRASLHTGGDPVRLRGLGHPRRNARFVLLIDGSRSMTEHARDILDYAHALVRRTGRARVFVFSTELREITYDLRKAALPDLGEAWGGGTRIGSTLHQFLHEHGPSLDDDTVTIVFSDGLDFGDAALLASAAARLDQRSAALIWVNPDAAIPGYVPATRGMRAVLPHASALVGTTELPKLATVVRRAVSGVRDRLPPN